MLFASIVSGYCRWVEQVIAAAGGIVYHLGGFFYVSGPLRKTLLLTYLYVQYTYRFLNEKGRHLLPILDRVIQYPQSL